MLEQIVKVINDFQEMYDAEKAKLKAEVTRIEKTYNPTGAEYRNMMGTARNTFNEKIEKERLVASEKIHECADEDRKTLADVTTTPAPADALSTIELLKAGNPMETTAFEVRSLLEKYKGNYLTTKMIIQITDAKRRFRLVFSSADDILDDIKEVEKMACDFVRQYNGTATYMQAVLLKGDIVMKVNERVQEFVKCDFASSLDELMRREMNA